VIVTTHSTPLEASLDPSDPLRDVPVRTAPVAAIAYPRICPAATQSALFRGRADNGFTLAGEEPIPSDVVKRPAPL